MCCGVVGFFMLTYFPSYCLGNQILFCFEETVLSHFNQFSRCSEENNQRTSWMCHSNRVSMREAETHSHNARLIGPCGSHSHKWSGTGSQAYEAARREKTGYRVRPLHNYNLFIHQPHLSFTSMTEEPKKSVENCFMIKFPQKTLTKLTLIHMIERRGQIQHYSSHLRTLRLLFNTYGNRE